MVINMSRRIAEAGKITLTETQQNAGQGGKLIFTTYEGRQAALLVQENRLMAAQFLPCEQSKVGAVYLCKVKNAVKNLDAYFVEIGGDEREICFLSKRDAAFPFLLNRPYDGRILEGDEFPVQVTRDAQKTKQTSVTTLISLSNDYFVLNIGERRLSYSRQLSERERELLEGALSERERELFGDTLTESSPNKKLSSKPSSPHTSPSGESGEPSFGIVVRTRAAELLNNADSTAITDALQELVERFHTLFQTAAHRTCFSCLLEAPAPWEAALEQLASPDEYEELLTDDESLFQRLQASGRVPPDKRIRYYDERQSAQLSLSQLYGLRSKLEDALSRRVWLKCGGYLIIEPTEALTVIDVNSGKYESCKAVEETYYRINREAAAEIAVQLRLRNLSGIIVVDFINMKERAHQKELLTYLKDLVRGDRQKTTVVDMTPLGLVELTRKKGSKPLREQLGKENYASEIKGF
ncbi:MAG: ribonuclease E/G [Muribaculum sp.]|nr:ribonuclease E/G [Muribaculum sp.]